MFVDLLPFKDFFHHRLRHYIEKDNDYLEKYLEYWNLLDNYIKDLTEFFDMIFIISDQRISVFVIVPTILHSIQHANTTIYAWKDPEESL